MMYTPLERQIQKILCDKTIQERQMLSAKNFKQTLIEKSRGLNCRRKATRCQERPKDAGFAWIWLTQRTSRTEEQSVTEHWVGIPIEIAERIAANGDFL
jgi:hypothetical protein